MINEKEKKMIEKYCKLPTIGLTSLIMTLGLSGVWFVLIMISELVFKDGDFENIEIGTYTYFILIAIYVVIFAYSYLSTHIGMRGRTWKNIVDRVSAEQTNKDFSTQMVASIGLSTAGRILKDSENESTKKIGQKAEVAGTIGQIATTAAIGYQMSRNAKNVAKASNIELPKIKGWVILLILLPILILTVSFIPGYIQANENLRKENRVVSETIYKLQAAFEKECANVIIDDPNENYQKYGYNVSAHLFDGNDGNYIYITVGNNGNIKSVSYNGCVDFQKSKEENIENIEKIYSKLHKLLVDSGVSLSSDMIERYTLSDEFKEKFINGSYDEEFFITESNNPSIYFVYRPYLESKYLEPRISIRISIKDRGV